MSFSTETLQQNLNKHLQQIVRERDPYWAAAGHFYVREYIRQELAKFGEVESFSFTVRGQSHQNLILNLSGDRSIVEKPPILVGAHYDTVPGSPGADDNATGVAVLLELAKFFSTKLARFTVRLVAFDLEEYGLLGSKAYAGFLKQHKQPLRLMLSLEMLGYCNQQPNSQNYPPGLQYVYPSQGNFIALIGNLKAIPELRQMACQIRQSHTPCEWLPVPLGGYPVPDTRRSDNAPFWDRGYKAIMVTDTANLRNPYYHTPQDTLATIDLEFLTGVCRGLQVAIQSL